MDFSTQAFINTTINLGRGTTPNHLVVIWCYLSFKRWTLDHNFLKKSMSAHSFVLVCVFLYARYILQVWFYNNLRISLIIYLPNIIDIVLLYPIFYIIHWKNFDCFLFLKNIILYLFQSSKASFGLQGSVFSSADSQNEELAQQQGLRATFMAKPFGISISGRFKLPTTNLLMPWEPTTFIFRAYTVTHISHIGGWKPAFFMVLASNGVIILYDIPRCWMYIYIYLIYLRIFG